MTCDQCHAVNATVKVEWGLFQRVDPMNEAELCNGCSDALWKECKGAVNAGFMHWKNQKINNETNT